MLQLLTVQITLKKGQAGLSLSTDITYQFKNIKFTVTGFKKYCLRAHLCLTSFQALLSSDNIFLPSNVSGKPC